MAVEDTEFGNLIGSDKVEGTAVYGADGEKIGSIERVMLDKKSGQVSYAVLAFGGFLGMGSEHYPLTWSTLKYNTELGGYQMAVTQDQLNGAPKYDNEDDWDWDDPQRVRAIDDYYVMPGAPGVLPRM
jgi:PRC-barrel domain